MNFQYRIISHTRHLQSNPGQDSTFPTEKNNMSNCFVIAKRTIGRRGNPSCLEGRERLVSSLTGSQWIATGSALAMTRCGGMVVCGSVTTRFCHCGERAERETRQSIVSRGRRTSLSARILVHSGSPRAFSPRDDKSEGGV